MKIQSHNKTGILFRKYTVVSIRLLLVLALGLFFFPAKAQTKYLADGYWIENYGKKEGLPENIAIDITQDRKGYLWITTPYNLVRFDGYEFRVFNPRSQFPDLYIHFFPGLIEDASGVLWMATNDKGLFSFDPSKQKFRRFYHDSTGNGLSDNVVNTILESANGDILVGTGKGLNVLSKKGETVTIKQFTSGYPASLLNLLDRVALQNPSLAAISKAGDFESRIVPFEISKTTKLLVVNMGEGADGVPNDYGWIENDKKERVWTYADNKSFSAGGASKNRLQLDIVTLPPGKYKLKYTSDDSHSWNSWNEAAPDRPDLWGIQLFRLSEAMIDSFAVSIKNSLQKKALHGEFIKTLLKGTGPFIWALTVAGLEKVDISEIASGKIKSDLVKLPSNFFTSYLMLHLDSNRLLLEGYLYQEKEKRNVLASLIYDHKKNSFRLQEESFLYNLSFNSKSFIKDQQATYWMGSFDNGGSGLFIADSGTELPHFRRIDISPPESKEPGTTGYEQIWTIFHDRSGNIWVGSRQNGLYKIKPVKMPALNTTIHLPGDNTAIIKFEEIQEDPAGNIWLGSEQNGVFRYDPKTKLVEHFPAANKATGRIVFFRGKDNAFVISAPNKAGQYQPSSGGLRSLPFSVPDSLQLVGLDSYGNYWAKLKSNDFSGIFYYYDGKRFQPVTDATGKKGFGFLRCIGFGKNGTVWISPAFEGVQQYIWNNETKKLALVKKFLPEGTDVYHIYEDESGIIWMGTYDNGLMRLDPARNQVTSFTKKEGLPSNFVFKVIPAGKKIWVLTDLGTALLDRETATLQTSKELDEYLLQNTEGVFSKFFYDDGFTNIAVPTRSGDIAMIARNGFISFNPDHFLKDSIKPVLQIARLQIDGQPVSFDGSPLKLKHFQNDLEIEYIGIHFDEPSKNQYAYFLKGANKDWINTGTGRIARFSNLPPGRYEFLIKAANADGVWSEPQQMMVFTILPPWWKTWWAYVLYIVVFAAAIWSFITYRSRRLRSENILLETKVANRTAELNQSLEDLKATQSQLIQSEKMASLGELTAGIAHEIQNPLNFVNNFSEVNTELIDELVKETEKRNWEEVNTLAVDIRSNEQKINHHGKRADAIVKGMLQHSRSSNGVKEPTDINALADEYLRLAYHGLRAKDKSFNATMKTDFDERTGLVSIIPQDIGRVILNLFTNAFYAVADKKKQLQDGLLPDGQLYEPTVSVSTKKENDRVEISVKDNGNGIPLKVVDKIFQPFFTTKPTGQGTGLGLSLSYDIVKAHGGQITVHTKENEGSEFVIELPG